MKRTAYLLLCILLIATLFSGCIDSSGADASESEDVIIGALLPLTGELSSIGEASQAAIEVSVDDINGYFTGFNSGKNVEVIIKDTESDPAIALEKLRELDEMGITIVIGPQSSNEAEAVLEYANENGITLLSTASTAPALAIPDDNLFRLVPDDTNQGLVLATVMHEDGIEVIVPVYRNDVWGNGISAEVTKSFEDVDGIVIEGIAYETDHEDFSSKVEALNEKVVTATSENNGAPMAVVLCSYSEVTEIFTLAQNYPALSEVSWYGTDGIALNKDLINDADAASFAAANNVKAPIYGYIRANDMYQKVAPRIEDKLGRMPESYALTTYDALWIATFVDLDITEENPGATSQAMELITNTYFGINGWALMDENGDRKYWNYDIWTVTEDNGNYQWELCGKVILPYEDNMLILNGDDLGFAQ